MNSILYTSENCFIVKTDAGVDEYVSGKIEKYCNTIKAINRKNEWKTSGAGAKFMHAYVPEYDDDAAKRGTSINGAAALGDEVVYSATMGEVSGLFRKTLDRNAAEGHIMSSRDIRIFKVSIFGDECAASVGNMQERHIAIFNIDNGQFRELTEGEVREDYPCYSRDGHRIIYSSAGLALTNAGVPVGVGPYGIFCYSVARNDMEELLASDKFDYIAPREDNDGSLLFIKKPYRNTADNGNFLLDILMFPLRIIKAIGGLLNYFSIAFGGESLRSGRSAGDLKHKQMSEKDLFFDGNVINAQEMLKQNQRRGEKFPGIIPHSWELTRLDENGEMHSIKKGVMDYAICRNGDIVYSNGNAVIRLLADGSEQLIEKRRMANNLIEMGV